jgi:hypothetical protein
MVRCWVIMLLLAGCGFLPEDDFTGLRAGDGIAPWTELGPAQICLGNEFLGPPASAPGGLCFGATVQEAPCQRDDDCRSREACVCGRCTVPYCASASDCAADRVCTFAENRCDTACFTEDDCAGGEECFNGVCRGRCLDDGDCQTGEVCNSRFFCITADCSDDGGCLAGERCRIQRTPRQVVEPSAVLDPDEPGGRTIVLYLEIAEELQRDETAIWRAVSRDGVHFQLTPAQPVVRDGVTARAPSVIRHAGGWAMYYEVDLGAAIRVTTSTDGVSWGPPATAITGGTGPAAARAPSAVALPDGSVAVYYQIGDGAAVALATGAIGGALTTRGPVLAPRDITVTDRGDGSPFWEDVVRVVSPYVAITDNPDGPALRLWYAAHGRESGDSVRLGEVEPIPPTFSIGYAAGAIGDPAALQAWPYGPVVDRVSAFLTHHEELSPAVLQLADRTGYLMYYVEADLAPEATGPDGPFEIRRLGVLGNGSYSATTGP